MKHIMSFFLVVTLMLVIAVPASQASLVYEFNPNDLIDLYDEGAPLGTKYPDNPRAVTGGSYTAYPGIGTWNTDEDSYNALIATDYNSWLDDGGYISGFNIWLADNPRARGWGEKVVIGPNTSLSATASEGWNVEVFTNPWDLDVLMAQWWTEDENYYLKKGGPDIGNFSFTANLYVDGNENGWDETDLLAVLGQDYTIWFGGYVGDTSCSPDDAIIMFQGTLDITATPEPTTMLLLGAGLLGLAGLGRKKFFNKD